MRDAGETVARFCLDWRHSFNLRFVTIGFYCFLAGDEAILYTETTGINVL